MATIRLRLRRVICTSCVICPLDVICATRVGRKRRIEYHCDRREQYHFCGAKISRRAVRDISLLNNYRPTEHRKVYTLYLAGKACEKEYGQNCPYSFFFVRQFKICFMVGTLQVPFCSSFSDSLQSSSKICTTRKILFLLRLSIVLIWSQSSLALEICA